MTFTESIKTCFSKYFTFAGRASRSEFWYFMLFCLLGNTILSLFDGFVLGMSSIQPASSVFVLVTFLSSICATTRRLHDGNRRGWWQLIWLAPIPVFIAAYGLNERSYDCWGHCHDCLLRYATGLVDCKRHRG